MTDWWPPAGGLRVLQESGGGCALHCSSWLCHLHSSIYCTKHLLSPRARSSTLQRDRHSGFSSLPGQVYYCVLSLNSCSGVPDTARTVFLSQPSKYYLGPISTVLPALSPAQKSAANGHKGISSLNPDQKMSAPAVPGPLIFLAPPRSAHEPYCLMSLACTTYHPASTTLALKDISKLPTTSTCLSTCPHKPMQWQEAHTCALVGLYRKTGL